MRVGWIPTVTSQALTVWSWSVLSLQSHRSLTYEELCTAQKWGGDSLIRPLLQLEATQARTDSWPAMDLALVALPVSCPHVSVQYSMEPAWLLKLAACV